jgi:hypothetical protein
MNQPTISCLISRRGMAVPVVILFVVVTFIFFTSMTISRQRVRQQNIVSFSQKQAYYLAMGGVQHALLKIRLLQRQAYDAASLARGVCPFFNMVGNKVMGNFSSPQLPNKCVRAMEIFLTDLCSPSPTNTNGIAFPANLGVPELGPGFANRWHYHVEKVSVLSYHTSTTPGPDYGTIRIALGIDSVGMAFDVRSAKQYRRELVQKEVLIERKMR